MQFPCYWAHLSQSHAFTGSFQLPSAAVLLLRKLFLFANFVLMLVPLYHSHLFFCLSISIHRIGVSMPSSLRFCYVLLNSKFRLPIEYFWPAKSLGTNQGFPPLRSTCWIFTSHWDLGDRAFKEVIELVTSSLRWTLTYVTVVLMKTIQLIVNSPEPTAWCWLEAHDSRPQRCLLHKPPQQPQPKHLVTYSCTCHEIKHWGLTNEEECLPEGESGIWQGEIDWK